MDETAATPKTFDEFTHFIAGILLVPEEKLTPETSFTDDLYVDSLKLVEMALQIEKLGVTIPTESYWEIQTVGEAFEAFKNHTNAGSEAG